MAVLSEVWRPDSGEIIAGGYTYYWSGRSDGRHAQGVVEAVSNKLTSMINEVPPVNEHIMILRIHHPVTPWVPTGSSLDLVFQHWWCGKGD